MIKKITGKIIEVIDLSKTAKDIHIKLSEPIDFIPGSFVNIFIDIDGLKVRRAYSVVSSSDDHMTITIAMRLSPTGTMSKLFWSKDMKGENIELMGPLGLNTVDKMNNQKIYLFAFGIGVGVVKSIAYYFSNINKVEKLTIITGSRSEDEIIYKDYFDKLSNDFKSITVIHVVSRGLNGASKILKGYIQDHIEGFDFNNADVYVCGQEKVCEDLVSKVKSMEPKDCNFFIEGFH